MLKALPGSRVTPVHRRIEAIRNERHVGVNRDARLCGEQCCRHLTSFRQPLPCEGQEDAIPHNAPPEPPRRGVFEAQHQPLLQEDEEGELHHRNRQGKATRRRRTPSHRPHPTQGEEVNEPRFDEGIERSLKTRGHACSRPCATRNQQQQRHQGNRPTRPKAVALRHEHANHMEQCRRKKHIEPTGGQR